MWRSTDNLCLLSVCQGVLEDSLAGKMQGVDEKDWRPPWAPLLRTSATFSYILGALSYTVLSSFF